MHRSVPAHRFGSDRRLLAAVLTFGLLALSYVALTFGAGSARAGTDDYPYKSAVDCSAQFGTYSWCIDGNHDGVFQTSEQYSPRGFAYRNCTDFAAFRLASRNGFSIPVAAGNANHWDDWARSAGYAVNGTPAPGSIAQTDAGSFGHVAWVESVGNGTVTVEEYNHNGIGTYDERTVATSTFVYIHVKDLPTNAVPIGHVDGMESRQAGTVHVVGWDLDPDAGAAAIAVHVYVGGQAGQPGAEGHAFTANAYRPDVGAAYPGYGDYHGIDVEFATGKTGAQQICVYAIDAQGGTNPLLGCGTVSIADPQPIGSLDSAVGGQGVVHVAGWAADPSAGTTPIHVHVYVGGPAGAAGAEGNDIGEASISRADVAAVYPWAGPLHGYDVTIPTALRGTQQICAYAINIGVGDNQGIGCQTVTITDPPPPSSRYEESAATYDGWQVFSDPTANGGTWRTSGTSGNTAAFGFTGSSVTWVSHKGPHQGRATVSIDGVAKGTVDLYSATTAPYSVTYGGLSATAAHTITVKVSGMKNAASTGYGVIVDAFTVGTTTTQESAAKVTYEKWKSGSSVNAGGGAYRSSGTANATASYKFTGTGVDWVTTTGPGWGKAEVYVDGVDKGTVDLYASTAHWQTVKTYGGLAAGAHTIRIKVLGAKNALAKATTVAVDAFVVHP